MRERFSYFGRHATEEQRQFAGQHLRAGILFLSLCTVLLGAYCLWNALPANRTNPGEIVTDPSPVSPEESDNSLLPPAVSDEPADVLNGEVPPETETEEIPPESEEMPPIPADYDFTKAVPESEAVDDSYFDRAVFFGDSRIHGFCLYSGLNRGACCAYKGLSTLSAFTDEIFEDSEGGEKLTAMEMLSRMDYDRIYIMLGINETGWPSADTFRSYYAKLIDAIREDTPAAQIYLFTVLPVSKEVSDTHPYVKNEKIAQFNQAIVSLAAEKMVYWIDLSPLADGEDGTLSADASADGIHLTRAYCVKWLELLRRHTIPANS